MAKETPSVLAREEGAPASPQGASPLCPRSLGHALPGLPSASLRAPSGQTVSEHLIRLFFRSSWRRQGASSSASYCPSGSLAPLLSPHPELLRPCPAHTALCLESARLRGPDAACLPVGFKSYKCSRSLLWPQLKQGPFHCFIPSCHVTLSPVWSPVYFLKGQAQRGIRPLVP